MAYFLNYLPVTTGNHTRLYVDGKGYGADLHADLRAAQRFVFLTGLHFMADYGLVRTGQPSDAAATVGAVLRGLGERGVAVYLLVNQFWKDESEVFKGGHAIRAGIMKGGELHGYLPETLKLFDALRGLPSVHCRTDLHPHSDVFATHHQKTVVIDDKIAYLGGIDLTFLDGDRWDTGAHRSALRHTDRTQKFWHDVHMRVQGEAVEMVRDNFVQRWRFGNLHTIRPKQLDSYESWQHHIAADPRPDVVVEALKDPRPPELPRFVVKPVSRFTFPNGDEQPSTPRVQIVRSMPNKDTWPRNERWRAEKPVWNVQRGVTWERSAKDAYLTGIAAASKYVYLENQWVADEDIWEALAGAARRNRRNPDFRILLMVPYEGLFAAGLGSNQELFIGEEIEEVVGQSHSAATFGMYSLYQVDRAASVIGQIYIHSKVLIVDDVWSLIGSANAGGISLEGVRSGKDQPDTELSAVVLDPAFGAAFRQRLWSEHLEGRSVGPSYDVRDADRFRGLAGRQGSRLRFFPGYDSVRKGVPTWLSADLVGRDPLRIDFKRGSRIIPSLGTAILSSGLPLTLTHAVFTAKIVPSVPPGWRAWYRWHLQAPYRPWEVPSQATGPPPKYYRLRSLRYDRDEVFEYSDQDVVYIGAKTAELLNARTTTAMLGVVRCRVKILPLDEGPEEPGPSMLLTFEVQLLNDTFARDNHPAFVRR